MMMMIDCGGSSCIVTKGEKPQVTLKTGMELASVHQLHQLKKRGMRSSPKSPSCVRAAGFDKLYYNSCTTITIKICDRKLLKL